jgi:hypothetical protein
MLFDVNREEALQKITALENSRKNIPVHLALVKQKARELSGFVAPLPEKEPFFRGAFPKDGYRLEKYALKGEEGCLVPTYVFAPEKRGKYPAIIYIHPDGKMAEANPGQEIENLVRKGFIVAVPDVINTGETKFAFRNDNPINFGSVLIGRSIVGMQAGDILRVVNFMKSRPDVDQTKIGGIAIAEIAPALMHAAAFDPSITSIAIIKAPVSYKSLVLNRYINFPFTCCVAGSLTAYDLPDLIGTIAPRKVALIETNDQTKKPASPELINQEMNFPLKVYATKNASMNLKIVSTTNDLKSILDWCFK